MTINDGEGFPKFDETLYSNLIQYNSPYGVDSKDNSCMAHQCGRYM